MPQNDKSLASWMDTSARADNQRRLQLEIFDRLGACSIAKMLPFGARDVTAGTENELAVAVAGSRADIDLPRAIAGLPFYREEGPARTGLERWIADNTAGVWEHSWLRLSRGALGKGAQSILDADLTGRPDRHDFGAGGDIVRVPASYVFKLALADVLGSGVLPGRALASGQRVLGCFLNDNTAPEIVSAYIVSDDHGLGRAVADENAQRFLLIQLLASYANEQFGLRERGQELLVYPAPNPPARLRRLSLLLPADVWRELMTNPCLSGFADGAAKRRYMHLCHETLSRSRVHADGRLVEAGIVKARGVTQLVCDTSLLNNGVHLSLGSRRLAAYFHAQPPQLAAAQEKYLGDLVAKIIEHFLPAFIGLYSAAPWRIAPAEMKPERALGFLPHQLHDVHLRRLWAAWKRKAGLLATLKGDFVPDQRLLDYFAALPGTAHHPGFDGELGNGERLKAELATRHVFSRDMTFYALCRLRELAKMGFTGFEGRHYSLFAGLRADLGPAADLQALITAYAYRLLASGAVIHAHIPDDPETESERRQMVFVCAAGLPSFYVRRATRNLFLRRVLACTTRTRPSKRHPGCYKVYTDDYRAALVRLLAADRGLAETDAPVTAELEARVANPGERAVSARLTRAILAELGAANATDVDAATFNQAAEHHYRGALRRAWTEEGLESLAASLRALISRARAAGDHNLLWAVGRISGGRTVDVLLAKVADELRAGRPSPQTLRALIGLILLNIDEETSRAARAA